MLMRRTLMTALLLVATACSSAPGVESTTDSDAGPPPLDAALIAEGRTLYDAHCASCHGADGAGAEDWKIANPDGSYPPPPHDSTGHTWHHSDRLLVDLIANGSGFAQTRMPTFADRLSTAEIEAILEYIKTWWGPEERTAQWEATQREG